MKKLVFAFCMLFGAVVVVNAQDTTSTPSPTDPTSTTPSPSQEQGRVKIKSQDLPDAVKSSLESQEYRGWLVNSAYKMEDDSQTDPSGQNPSDTTDVSGNTGDTGSQEVYIVELKNGAQTKTVRFDKDGKKLEDEGMKDDQK